VPEPPFVIALRAAGERGDPPADNLVAALRALPAGAGARLLGRALADGAVPAGAPPELDALLAPLREPPAWLDPGLLDAGAVATWRAGGLPLFLALTYGSLAFGYQSARLARPLARTGRLERMAGRRLAETSRWYVAATAPGGMHVGAGGWRATVRTRVVHAHVRDHLRRSGAWDDARDGVPISQADAFATAIGGFFVIPMRALRDLGVRHSPAEQEAIAHLWRWIGWVMGVPDALLPDGAAQAAERVALALELDDGPSEDGARLMRALLEHGLPITRLVPGPAGAPARALGVQLAGGLARRWLGPAMADRLDVPGRALAPLVPLMRPAAQARAALCATGLLGSDDAVARRELAFVRRLLAAGARAA
jgi:hypothetical protein